MIRKILFLPLLVAILFTQQTAVAQKKSDEFDLNNFRLHADQVAIKAGQSVNLSVLVVNPLTKKYDKSDGDSERSMDDLLAPLAKKTNDDSDSSPEDLLGPLAPESKEGWSDLSKLAYKGIRWHSTVGKVTQDPKNPAKAILTVPSSTRPTLAYITATITGLRDVAGLESNMVNMLTTQVSIDEDQYVAISIDGKDYIIDGDPENGGFIYHKRGDDGRFSFKAGIGNKTLLVTTDAYEEGTYPYGNYDNEEERKRTAGVIWYEDAELKKDSDETHKNAALTANDATASKEYHTSYKACFDCKTIYSPGGVRLRKIEKTGEEVKLTKAEEAALRTGKASPALYEKLARQVANAKTTYVEGFCRGTLYDSEGRIKKFVCQFRVKDW